MKSLIASICQPLYFTLRGVLIILQSYKKYRDAPVYVVSYFDIYSSWLTSRGVVPF